jgi:hypothetical protein
LAYYGEPISKDGYPMSAPCPLPSTKQVTEACRRHGARSVYDAAVSSLEGDSTVLDGMGLVCYGSVVETDRILRRALQLLPVHGSPI